MYICKKCKKIQKPQNTFSIFFTKNSKSKKWKFWWASIRRLNSIRRFIPRRRFNSIRAGDLNDMRPLALRFRGEVNHRIELKRRIELNRRLALNRRSGIMVDTHIYIYMY